jgi:DNA-binding NarL/FixJ family response regulator
LDEGIRILIADDHPLMRKGLRLSVEEDPGLKVVGEAADGEAALALITKLQPRVALLDIEMPKLDGLGVAREVVERRLKTEIVILTLHSNQDLFRSAMDLGCKGYILKDSAVQEVVAGIHAVASGRPYISSAITADLLQSRKQADPKSNSALTSNLTPTELRIMRLIASGKSSKEIGADLSIHYRTVENHRTNICRKLELDGEGANALLRFALQNKNIL